MNRNQVKSLLILGAEFSKVSTGIVADCLIKLRREEIKLHRFYNIACMRDVTEKEDKAADKCQERVKKICETLGCKVRFNADPRGGAICLILPSGRHNSWDGETWRIDY